MRAQGELYQRTKNAFGSETSSQRGVGTGGLRAQALPQGTLPHCAPRTAENKAGTRQSPAVNESSRQLQCTLNSPSSVVVVLIKCSHFGMGFATQLSFLKETVGQQLLQTLAWGILNPTDPQESLELLHMGEKQLCLDTEF